MLVMKTTDLSIPSCRVNWKVPLAEWPLLSAMLNDGVMTQNKTGTNKVNVNLFIITSKSGTKFQAKSFWGYSYNLSNRGSQMQAFRSRGAPSKGLPVGLSNYFLASKMRLNGVSVARRNSLKPPAKTTSRIADSGAMAPSAGPFIASAFEVQQSVEAPEKVRPMMLKFSSTVLPAIGSTINALPSAPNTSAALLQAPMGSPMSCKQSKNVTRSYCSSGSSLALATAKVTRSETPASSARCRAVAMDFS